MRTVLILAGVILIALGVATTMGEFSYKKNTDVVKFGGFTATAQEQKTVPVWVGIGGIVIGAGLALAGLSRRQS